MQGKNTAQQTPGGLRKDYKNLSWEIQISQISKLPECDKNFSSIRALLRLSCLISRLVRHQVCTVTIQSPMKNGQANLILQPVFLFVSLHPKI
jgi:hypothetical protein